MSGMGCRHTTDSLHCTAETAQHCKAVILRKKIKRLPAEAFDSSDGRIKEGGEQLPSDPKPHLPHGTLVGLMN